MLSSTRCLLPYKKFLDKIFKNNFSSEFLCSLPDDSGTFAEGVPDKPRFAWSSQVNSCWRFSYYGAKGNYNNFPNFQECVNFCGNEK
ncbi:unnamed protein product [Meloidogyne enterolobii]|uniref:Uncharacterized protein n=1 Tax=Meloidogyne enterolobii TaxID=390850 RepID=A0ACB0Z3D2_MELEN